MLHGVGGLLATFPALAQHPLALTSLPHSHTSQALHPQHSTHPHSCLTSILPTPPPPQPRSFLKFSREVRDDLSNYEDNPAVRLLGIRWIEGWQLAPAAPARLPGCDSLAVTQLFAA